VTDPILLTTQEACAVLGVGRTTLLAKVKPELPTVRVGRALRFPLSGVEAWVESHTDPATAATEAC
jgi:excisionase family DNA binding protein